MHALFLYIETSRKKICFRKCYIRTYSDVNRQQWENILSFELMSTDESDYADDGKEILVTHQLSWYSDTVNNFKQLLDQESMKGKSQQFIRQMKTRIEGSPSTR